MVVVGFRHVHLASLSLNEPEAAGGHAQSEEDLAGDGGIHVSSVEGIAHPRSAKADRLHIVKRREVKSEVDLPLGASHTQATGPLVKMMTAETLSTARRSAALATAFQHVNTGADDQGRRWRAKPRRLGEGGAQF